MDPTLIPLAIKAAFLIMGLIALFVLYRRYKPGKSGKGDAENYTTGATAARLTANAGAGDSLSPM